MIILALLLAGAAAAPAQDFAMPEELGAAVQSSRQLGAGAPQAVRALRSADEAAPASEASAAPINTGFRALGAAGQTGTVKGPGLFGAGDGTYRVVNNSPYKMVFDMQTGYVNGRFTLKRDPATGRDLLGFAGQTRGASSDWTSASGSFAGAVVYNPESDSGTISWRLNGERHDDTFQNGRAGSRSMTITLSGNAHTFTQN